MTYVRHKVATRARLLAALSLCSFVFGSLGPLIHEASTVHTVCPEHGELIHGAGEGVAVGATVQAIEAGALVAPLRRSVADTDGPDVARMRGMPRASGHGHDHCFVHCASRDRTADPAAFASAQEAPLALQAPLARAADHPESAGRPIYFIAPKNSPPA